MKTIMVYPSYFNTDYYFGSVYYYYTLVRVRVYNIIMFTQYTPYNIVVMYCYMDV